MATIYYTIETLQPVKIATQGSQTETQIAPDFLPGTSLPGALLANYAKTTSLNLDHDGNERKRWLNGNTRFLNAYPYVNGKRTYPFPNHLYASKSAMKKFESGSSQELHIKNVFKDAPDDNDKRVGYSGFAEFTGNQLIHHTTNKKFYLHVNLSEKINKMFRYEAIEAHQSFQGAIIEADETMQKFVQSLENKQIYIGGSRSSGYGRCHVKQVVIDDSPQPSIATHSKKIYVYALSEWLLRDDYGRPSSTLSAKMIEQQIGDEHLKLQARKAAVQTTNVGGYIEKWCSPLPVVSAVQRGSIYAFDIVNGTINSEKIQALQEKGIGDRRVEGFGQLMIWGEENVDIASIIRPTLSQTKDKHPINQKIAIKQKNEEDNVRLKKVLKRGQQAILQKASESHILKLHESTKINSQVSPSQISKIMQLAFTECMRVKTNGEAAIETSKQHITNYFNHLIERTDGVERTNQKAKQQLDRFRVNNKSIIEFYQSFVEEADAATYEEYFGSTQVTCNRADKYVQSLRMLEQYLRFERRIREQKNKSS